MKQVSVRHWGSWHRKIDAILTVDDDGYGVIDDVAVEAFRRGQCHALAIALHKLTGWTIKGLGRRDEQDAPDSPAHCVVYCPALRTYVDIGGKVSRGYYNKNRGWKVLNRNVAPRQVRKFRLYLKPNVEAAIPFAKSILRDLGVEFSTGNRK
jgi:hypothetical protein